MYSQQDEEILLNAGFTREDILKLGNDRVRRGYPSREGGVLPVNTILNFLENVAGMTVNKFMEMYEEGTYETDVESDSD